MVAVSVNVGSRPALCATVECMFFFGCHPYFVQMLVDLCRTQEKALMVTAVVVIYICTVFKPSGGRA